MDFILDLTNSEYKDLTSYCDLNKFDYHEVAKKSYLEGLRIEKYGLLNSTQQPVERIVEKEVIKYVEVPKEIEKEVIKIEYVNVPKEVIKEVPVEKIVEVIKEVPVEKVVEVIKEVIVEKPVDRVVEVIKEVPVDKVALQEVVKEVPVERVVEKVVEVIKEVPVEKIVEVIKEVPVETIREVVVEKDSSGLKEKLDAIQVTVQKLRSETIEKDKQIKQLEATIQEIQNVQEKRAVYLQGSNLNKTL